MALFILGDDMAQYDGSILIDTKIEVKQAEKELKRLESSISKTAQEIASLRSKMDVLKDVKIPTSEYKKAQNELDKIKQKYEEVSDTVRTFEKTGADKEFMPFRQARDKAQELYMKMEDLRGKLFELGESGKAFTLGIDTEKYAEMSARVKQLNQQMQSDTERQTQLQDRLAEREKYLQGLRENAVVGNQRIIETVERIKQLEQEIADLKSAGRTEGYDDYDSRVRELSDLKREITDYNNSTEQVKETYKHLGDVARNALNSIGNLLKRANSAVNSFGNRIKEAFSKIKKSSNDATKGVNKFGLSLKNILKYSLGFQGLYSIINKIRSAIKEGFENLSGDRGLASFRNSVDSLKASALTLKNAFAAAFSPFVEIALPYVQKLLDYMTQLLNVAGQFFAAITGRKTYIKAIKQTTDALKEETKEMNKQLSPLDKLNDLTSQKDKAGDSTGGPMFEEVPLDKSILDMAEKVKDILSKLFAPLKEAWECEGKFVMDSWKYALDEVSKLIKDIGRDFLAVWQQEKTVKIFEDLLHIIGDIGLVVGNLARNFREAWNENETGLRTLENIRDIIGVIVHNIRLAADETVKWADKLNFKPLLEAFERFTRSLIPLADALSGVLADFYTKVLLPLAKWSVEKGLPELLDVFTSFNEKVDWQALRNNLAEFWEHLEPFAETIGEGLIIFIQRVSDVLADFLNSQELKNFLVMIEDWMDSVSPEGVANGLEMIAAALIGLKAVLLGYGAINGIVGAFEAIKKFVLDIAPLGGMLINGAKLIASGIGSILSAIGSIPAVLAMVAAAVVGWKIGEWINENLLGIDTPSFFEIMDGIKSSFADGSWKEAIKLWRTDIADGLAAMAADVNNWGADLSTKFYKTWEDLKSTTKEALSLWKDDIYNAFVTLGERQSEWLNSLKNKWLQTWNNIKAGISGVISSIKSTVGTVLDWISSKLKSLQSIFSSIGSGFSGSGGLFGKSRSGASTYSTYSAQPAQASYIPAPIAQTLANAEIPAIATGQIIPTSVKRSMASSGSGGGMDVAALTSAIKEATVTAMAEVNGGGGSNNNSGSGQAIDLHLTVECEGYKLLELMRKLDGEFFKQNGKHALA